MAEEPWAKSGPLSRVTKGQFSKKIKDLYAVLYKGFGSNVARLELYENEKAVSSGIHMFMLVCSDLMKITKITGTSREENHSFVLATKDQQYVFILKNAHECDQWVEAIKDLMQSLQSPTATTASAATPDQKSSSGTVTVDNDIYDSFTEACSDYTVTVGKETRQKVPVDGPVRLVVEDRHITIIGPGGNRLVRWNIKNLRRIGYSEHEFHVEAGRRCESGVGYYSFDTKMGRQIYVKVEEEKLNYSNPTTKDVKETLPACMVSSVVRNDSPPLAIGGHIYEEFHDIFKHDKEKRVPGQNHKSEKPPQVPPFVTKEAAPSTISVPATVSTEYSGVPPVTKLGTRQSTRPVPAENGLIRPSSEMVLSHSPIPGFTGAAKIPGDIYEEVKKYKDAWKQYGIGDKETPEEDEAQYENLRRFRPTEEVEESHYSVLSESETRKQRPPRDASPIYAQVNKMRPKPKKK